MIQAEPSGFLVVPSVTSMPSEASVSTASVFWARNFCQAQRWSGFAAGYPAGAAGALADAPLFAPEAPANAPAARSRTPIASPTVTIRVLLRRNLRLNSMSPLPRGYESVRRAARRAPPVECRPVCVSAQGPPAWGFLGISTTPRCASRAKRQEAERSGIPSPTPRACSRDLVALSHKVGPAPRGAGVAAPNFLHGTASQKRLRPYRRGAKRTLGWWGGHGSNAAQHNRNDVPWLETLVEAARPPDRGRGRARIRRLCVLGGDDRHAHQGGRPACARDRELGRHGDVRERRHDLARRHGVPRGAELAREQHRPGPDLHDGPHRPHRD